MKKSKYISLTLMLSLISVPKIYAICTEQEKTLFETTKDKYKITYEFNINTKLYDFTLKRELPDRYDYNIHVVSVNDEPNKVYNTECIEIDDKVTKCTNYPSGKYYFTIVGQTATCQDTFDEETLELPEYNKFYEDPLCEGIEEFVLCQPTYSKKIDYETFVSRVNTYKKTKQEKQEENKQDIIQNENEGSMIKNIVEYIKNNLLQVIIITTFLILLGISTIVTINSLKKSRRLE